MAPVNICPVRRAVFSALDDISSLMAFAVSCLAAVLVAGAVGLAQEADQADGLEHQDLGLEHQVVLAVEPDPREADAIRLRFETDDPAVEAVWLIELANDDDVLDRPEYPPGKPVITHFRYGGRWYPHPGVDHSSRRETDAPPRPRVE